MYRRRRRKLMIMAAMAGAPIGAIFGYLFGYFAFSNMDVAKTFHAEDKAANAMLFLWLFALLFAFLASRLAREYSGKLDKRDVQRLRREKYADVIAAHERDKANEPREDEYHERARSRRSSR